MKTNETFKQEADKQVKSKKKAFEQNTNKQTKNEKVFTGKACKQIKLRERSSKS